VAQRANIDPILTKGTKFNLSTRSAEASVQRGIDAGRLVPQGLGEAQPVASNDTPEGRALNRGIELVRVEPQPNIVVSMGGGAPLGQRRRSRQLPPAPKVARSHMRQTHDPQLLRGG
jgi:hypothetical protein